MANTFASLNFHVVTPATDQDEFGVIRLMIEGVVVRYNEGGGAITIKVERELSASTVGKINLRNGAVSSALRCHGLLAVSGFACSLKNFTMSAGASLRKA